MTDIEASLAQGSGLTSGPMMAYAGFAAAFFAGGAWAALYSPHPLAGAVAGMIALSLFIVAEGLALLANWRNSAFTVASRIWTPDYARRRRWRIQAQAWGAIIAFMGIVAIVATARAAAR